MIQWHDGIYSSPIRTSTPPPPLDPRPTLSQSTHPRYKKYFKNHHLHHHCRSRRRRHDLSHNFFALTVKQEK